MPINISVGSPQITTSGGVGGNAEAPGGIDGIFAALLDLLGASAIVEGQPTSQPTGQAGTQQSSQSFFSFQLGDLSASLDSAEFPTSLSELAKLLGFETESELDPDAPLAGLAGPLADLLNNLAAKLQTSGDAPTEQATAALQLARGLIRQAGGGDVDLAQVSANRDATQAPSAPLVTQLRAAAADLNLVRQSIPIPTARADAIAVFNGTAPTLDELLNPQPDQNRPGARNEGQTDNTRLANSLGANMAAKASATSNQPAPGATSPQSLASALADAGIKANLTAQNQMQADPLQNAQITATGAPTISSDVSAAVRPMQAAYQAPQINMQQLAFNIASQFKAGNSRFQIRMDPPELGRIDVRMQVDPHGAIHARLAVERPETLDMLRNDSRLLERALQQAGLDQSKTTLEFSLRQNGSGGERERGSDRTAQGDVSPPLPIDETTTQSAKLSAYRGTASPGGLNLWV